MIWVVSIPALAFLAFCAVMACSARARIAFCDWLDRRDERRTS